MSSNKLLNWNIFFFFSGLLIIPFGWLFPPAFFSFACLAIGVGLVLTSLILFFREAGIFSGWIYFMLMMFIGVVIFSCGIWFLPGGEGPGYIDNATEWVKQVRPKTTRDKGIGLIIIFAAAFFVGAVLIPIFKIMFSPGIHPRLEETLKPYAWVKSISITVIGYIVYSIAWEMAGDKAEGNKGFFVMVGAIAFILGGLGLIMFFFAKFKNNIRRI